MKNKIKIIIGVLIVVVIIGVANMVKSKKTANVLDLINIGKDSEKGIVEVIEQEEQVINNIQEEKEEVESIQNQPQYYKVVKVIDGDTITVDIDGTNQTIRLIGINTPETVDPRKPVECFGKEASNKAKELLSGQWVELESDSAQGDKGKYGRFLRYVRIKDGLFYNLEIIEQGYAYEYTYNTQYKYQAEFKQAENYARSNKLGLWADGVCDKSAIIEQEKSSEPKQTSCDCSSNKYNCTDFATHNEAQSLFDCCGGILNDIHGLDKDGDGIACENLP